MADEALLQILRQGVDGWNDWMQEHPEDPKPDLSSADLSNMDLSGVNFSKVNLSDVNLFHAHLPHAILRRAILRRANLNSANLWFADLSGADLFRTSFYDVNLSDADLSGTKLSGTTLIGANLSRVKLSGSKFFMSLAEETVFSDLDLREAEGLETIDHIGPSPISISTIYKSEGKIPEAFLRGCGVPESFIAQIPTLVAAIQPIQFYSCFISYSTKDVEFARRLHARMRQADLRVWFAPEDIKGGKKLYEQIDRAIQIHDRLLIVLSENSMQSEWVMTEIRRARKTEVREGRRKLFPIRLVDYEAIRDWECFDADTGKDLAVEVREFYIPDFSNWKNNDDFEREFNRLYESLKAEA